jgi:hypothetical protein
VRCDIAIATRRGEVARVVALVRADRSAAPTGHVRVEHGERVAPLGATVREVDLKIHD